MERHARERKKLESTCGKEPEAAARAAFSETDSMRSPRMEMRTFDRTRPETGSSIFGANSVCATEFWAAACPKIAAEVAAAMDNKANRRRVRALIAGLRLSDLPE